MEDRKFSSIEEVRAAFYPGMAKVLELPEDAIIALPPDFPRSVA